MGDVKAEEGKYLSASCAYRGKLSTQEIDDELLMIQKLSSYDAFVTWIPNNIKSSLIEVPPEGSAVSATFVANTTAIRGVFQRISEQFSRMFRRKAFMHWYKDEGMDEMEFLAADNNVRDLITEYQDKQDVDLFDDEEEDEEEEEEEY